MIETSDHHLSAIKIDARHARKLLERALSQAERAEFETAILACRQPIRLLPDSFPAHSLLSMLLRREGILDEAIAASEKAFAILPDSEWERARLTELRAAKTNGQGPPSLHLGEWDSFRQEMQREIKLSTLLPSIVLPLPVPNESTAVAAVLLPFPSERIVSTQTKDSGEIYSRVIWLGGATVLAILLAFFVVRKFRPAAPITSADSIETTRVQSSENPNIGNTVSNSVAAIDPSHDGSTRVRPPSISDQPPIATRPQGSRPLATPNTSTPTLVPVPTVVPITRHTDAQQDYTPQPASRTGDSSSPRRVVPESPPRTQISPIAIPVAPSASAASGGSNDEVGPRFSPAKPDDNDDVGPRFSTP